MVGSSGGEQWQVGAVGEGGGRGSGSGSSVI